VRVHDHALHARLLAHGSRASRDLLGKSRERHEKQTETDRAPHRVPVKGKASSRIEKGYSGLFPREKEFLEDKIPAELPWRFYRAPG
jgi:hypothetical protein